MVEIKGVSVLDGARFGCRCSGGCCGGYLYGPIDDETAARIANHRFVENADQIYGVGAFDEGVVHGKKVRVLRRIAGHCVFLGSDHKCVIHKEMGSEAKPIFCRIYPLNVALAPDGIAYISLNMECLGDGAYEGPLIEEEIADDLETLVEQASLELGEDVIVRPGEKVSFDEYLETLEQPWLASLESGQPLDVLRSIWMQLFEIKEESRKISDPLCALLKTISEICAEDEADSLAEDDVVDAGMNRAVREACAACDVAALFKRVLTPAENQLVRLELQNALFGKAWLRASSLQVACVVEAVKLALAFEVSKAHRFSKALALVNRVLRLSTLAAPEWDALALAVGEAL